MYGARFLKTVKGARHPNSPFSSLPLWDKKSRESKGEK